MKKNWKPSRTKAREFSQKMKEIEEFCIANGIQASSSYDSYYFIIDGQEYRVSNHTIESSNAAAYVDGIKVRDLYHESQRSDDIIYIHAGKTRIIEIFSDLKSGYELDGRGNRKES